jgi:hypothetical protein
MVFNHFFEASVVENNKKVEKETVSEDSFVII